MRHGTSAAHRAGLSGRTLWIVGAAVACAWFLTLDARHLLPADEGRYAEIAREIYTTGDWVTIRYNGLKYFEKPPFHLWMTALAFHAFGVGEWQARLWTACSGAIGLLATAFAANRLFGPRPGLLAALVLLAMPAWNIAGHFASLDMSLSGALALALAALLVAQSPQTAPKARRAWMMGCWAAIGVAILTKGPIGIVLPALALGLYSLIARDRAIWRRLNAGVGVLVLAAITLPWFVLVTARNPDFARFFFIHEHWDRYTSGIHHRSGPVWYFVPQFLLGALPWLGLSLATGRVVAGEAGETGFRPRLLLAAWAGAIFVFFSFSGSKLPGYILPMYPALAILVAVALDELTEAAWKRQLAGAIIGAALALAATPLLARLGSEQTPNALYRAFVPWAAAAGIVILVGSLASRAALRAGTVLASQAIYALAFFAAITIGLLGHEKFGRSSSGADLAAAMRPRLTPDMPVYSVRLLDHTVPFYLRHETIPVETPGELEFGVREEPDRWLPTLAAFEAAWSSKRPAMALMSRQTYRDLQALGLPMEVVAKDARRVAVTNAGAARR